MPHAQFQDALIIGKKRVKFLTASIIEFDLLFNATRKNNYDRKRTGIRLWLRKDEGTS